MEFDFSRFFTAVCVDVLNLDHIRDKLDNFYNSVNFIDFDQINDFLLEEFDQSSIALFSELGILVEVFLHLHCEHVNQVFGSRIGNWNLYNSVFEADDIDDSVDG